MDSIDEEFARIRARAAAKVEAIDRIGQACGMAPLADQPPLTEEEARAWSENLRDQYAAQR